MKERLTRNFGLKVVSVILGFVMWISVINIANPTKVSNREVPVEIINAQVLENANLAYEVMGRRTATISFKVRTKDEYKITASDFRVYADVSEMYDVTGAIPIKVDVLNHDNLIESKPDVYPEVIRINTEPMQTKEFKVQAYPLGTPEEGFLAGGVNISPSIVSVKGPESLVGQISSVGIEYSIAGASGDVAGYATPEFYDANGNKLTLDESVQVIGGDVYYVAPILKVKTVPLDFVVAGSAADGYKFTGVNSPVTEVSVAGLKSDIATLNKITIADPVLDVTGADADVAVVVDIKKYVEPGVNIAGMDSTEIQLVLQVEKLENRVYVIEPGDITLNGMSDHYDYRIDIEDHSVRLEGLKEDLDALSTTKMNLYVDVSGLDVGEHTMPVRSTVGDAYELIETPMIRVIVTEKE